MCNFRKTFTNWRYGSTPQNYETKRWTDKYQNLIFITNNIHKLVHITDKDKINEYLKNENLNEEQMQKLNELRELVENYKLV